MCNCVPVAIQRQWSSIKRTLNSQLVALNDVKEVIHMSEDTGHGFPVHVGKIRPLSADERRYTTNINIPISVWRY